MENKQFDSVEIKRQAQAKMREDFAGLTDAEERSRIRQELEKSDSVVARKWRIMMKIESAPVRKAG